MGENERMDDAAYTDDVLKALTTSPAPASLEARILADFDRVAAKRGLRLAELVAAVGNRLWPGAPVWQPASALVLSLVIGLTAGAFLPAPTANSAAPDQVVAALDTTPEMDLDRDL